MTTWIDHVKKTAKKNKISYKEAMSVAKLTYKSKKSSSTKKVKSSSSKTKSKTHPGDLNYTTKKGDKDFHESKKDVKKSRKPYTKRVKRKASKCSCHEN